MQTERVRTNDESDLQLLDTIADSDKLARTPYEALHLDRSDRFFQSLHIRLVVPRLDLQSDNRLSQITLVFTSHPSR